MGIKNENFVLVGSLNTLSLVYMNEYYKKNKMIHTFMFQKHIHKVKFYPSADDFTQAPLVMLVTNIMSEVTQQGIAEVTNLKYSDHPGRNTCFNLCWDTWDQLETAN